MTQTATERHDDLVRFLEEQTELADRPTVQLFEPIVQIRPENITFGDGCRVDSFVKLEGGIELVIGKYVHIASFAHIGIGGGRTILGDYSAFASGSRVISGSNQIEGLTMSACAPQAMQRVSKKVTRIGRFATVLTNAVVLPGITLGEGAVLAAGSVASKDIPPWEVWGGVPAKFIRKREASIGGPR